jgi:hypothetical protein
MDNAENRRKSRRYSMEVPVRLGDQEGQTLDVSTRGLYFVGPIDMKPGAAIEMDLALPSAQPGPLSIRLRARIVRMDDLGDSKGMAAEIHEWEIPEGGINQLFTRRRSGGGSKSKR